MKDINALAIALRMSRCEFWSILVGSVDIDVSHISQ